MASEAAGQLDLTESWYGVLAVLVSAGIIWALVGMAYAAQGDYHTAEIQVRHALLEYASVVIPAGRYDLH